MDLPLHTPSIASDTLSSIDTKQNLSSAETPPFTTTSTTVTSQLEENKAKSFFKKTFFTPFKKLDNFIQEHKKDVPNLNLAHVIKSGSSRGKVLNIVRHH